MATQTLKYKDPIIAPVAIDQAGNLVTDNAGNLVIPIEPFYIACTITNYGSDPDYEGTECYTMTVTLPDRTVSYYRCPDKFESDEIAVIKNRRIKFNARTLKEKYGDTFTMTVDVFADYEPILRKETHDGKKVKCEYIYYNRSGITIWWGNSQISSQTDACSNPSRHTAKFTINFTDMTISSDTKSINVGSSVGKQCDKFCYEDLEPYEVTIHCDKALCDDGRTVYMSTSYNRIFASQMVVVKVEPSENEEEEIKKASICDVFSHTQKAWITPAELIGRYFGRYFRDKDKDQAVGSDFITAYKCQKDDDANDNLWVEKRPTDADVTGRVWDKVWEGAPAEGVGNPEYLATKNVVAKDLKWEYRSEESDFTADIYLDDGYHPCAATYGGMASFICNGTFHMQPYFFLKPKDDCPQLEDFLVYGMVYSGEEISVEEYFELYLDSVGINPRAECDGDGRFIEYVDYEFNIGGSITRNGTGETGFYHNDKFYVLVPSGDVGYVYGEPEVNARGWSKSPCHQTLESFDTIYTKTENPGFGDEYGIITNGVFQWQGTISAFGNALYSVTGSDGITRYWKADIEVQEEIDEEFE